MEAILAELEAVMAEARASKIRAVVIGACALRTYLPSPDKRVSGDADVLTTSAALPDLRRLLEGRGYRLYTTGRWWRAERIAAPRVIIDVAVDSIVDVRSYTGYSISWELIAERQKLPVAALEDLVAQKLISAREKDLLDVILVARENVPLDAQRLRNAVEAQDVEIAVRRGVLEASALVRSGRMAALWRERYPEEIGQSSLDAAMRRIEDWIE